MCIAPVFLLLLSAQSFDELLRSGLTALASNDLKAARAQLEAASKLEPERPQVWLGLAQTYWKLDQKDLAEPAARRAETLARDDSVVIRGLLIYYSESGSAPARLIELAERAVALAPDEAHYFEVVQLLLGREKFDAALAVLKTGLKRFPDSAQLELARGVALYGLRRFAEAIDSFLRTIRLAPEVPQPYLFLGRMLDQAQSKSAEIVRVFAGLHKSDPGNFMASLLYAKGLIAQQGDLAQAESLLRESIGLKSDYWESHFELGRLLEERRQFMEAAAELERAVELNPNDPAAHYRLARIYDRLGKKTEADAQRALHAKLLAQGGR